MMLHVYQVYNAAPYVILVDICLCLLLLSHCLSTIKAARSNDDWEYETVLFVPYTPDGALATALRAYEKKRGAKKRIRIVERAGVSLKSNTPLVVQATFQPYSCYSTIF